MTKTKILCAALLGLALATAAPAAAEQQLRNVESLGQFAAAFNADEGETRLVLLLSPT